jgi:dCMP deaminase
MKGPYLVKDKITGKYRSAYSEYWTVDLSRARVYPRSCDAKNSMNTYGNQRDNIRTQNFDGKYELVPCVIALVTELKQGKQKKNYKVTSSFTAPSTNCGPKTFTSLTQAQEHARQWSHECGLHLDYFTITPTDEVPGRIRPNWTEYFLGLALVVSKRSHDQHTQHGCILVDGPSHRILSTGYNGFPRGMKNDSKLPLNRPDPAKPNEDNKYPWMLHSEFNACCNLKVPADKNTVAYITGEPCTPCIMCLWQHGVEHIVYRNYLGSKYLIDEVTRKRRDLFLQQSGMKIECVDVDLSWLEQTVLPPQ